MSIIVHVCDQDCPILSMARCKREIGHDEPHRTEFRKGGRVAGAHDRLVIEWWQHEDDDK